MSDSALKHQPGEVFLYLAISICFCVLYAPQPMLSELADRFMVSKPEAGLLVSITLIPMALAPLTYGVVLRQLSALTILKWALPLLAVSMALSGQVNDYNSMLLLRLVQGALMPAILTATMAYLAAGRTGPALSRVMAIYIASTIVGGMAGRVISGQLAAFLDWSWVSLIWAGLLLMVTLTPWRKATPKPLNLIRPSRAGIVEAISSGGNRAIYLAVLCAFWVFAGYLNYLPFRINEIDPAASTALVGLSYLGYSIGVVSALSAGWVAKQLGGAIRACFLGFAILLASLGMTFFSIEVLMGQVFVMCLGMFLIHTLAAAEVNHNAKTLGGVVNGLYVSAYYAGGALGAWVTGYVYEVFGWTAFVGTLAAVGLLGMSMMVYYARLSAGNGAR